MTALRSHSVPLALLGAGLLMLSTPPCRADGPIGFASIDAHGRKGTTGGAGGKEVTVKTADEFLASIAKAEPLIVRVEGLISLPGPMHDIASHKTIVGIGAKSGITGGGLNVGLPTSKDANPPKDPVHNVIIRNLVIAKCPDDCINVQSFSHHVWIDHNDISQPHDGALDIKRGSDCVTVSWNHFHDTDKNMLVGHDDKNAGQDRGRLRVTYHHNWFDGSKQRNPRVRFGEPVHIFNNYYRNNTGYGIASQIDAGVVVEGNYFENVKKPTRTDVTGKPGRIVERKNVFEKSEKAVSAGKVVEPSTFYKYELEEAAKVPEIVKAGAGTGKVK